MSVANAQSNSIQERVCCPSTASCAFRLGFLTLTQTWHHERKGQCLASWASRSSDVGSSGFGVTVTLTCSNVFGSHRGLPDKLLAFFHNLAAPGPRLSPNVLCESYSPRVDGAITLSFHLKYMISYVQIISYNDNDKSKKLETSFFLRFFF